MVKVWTWDMEMEIVGGSGWSMEMGEVVWGKERGAEVKKVMKVLNEEEVCVSA